MVYYGEASRTYPSKVDVGTKHLFTRDCSRKGYHYAVVGLTIDAQ
jgi:hypothetical protein